MMYHIQDNFFNNPKKIRKLAIEKLAEKYDCIINDNVPYYPGIRCDINGEIANKIQNFLRYLYGSNTKLVGAKFHITSSIHGEGLIHRDAEPFAGLIYLNENPPNCSGTIICSKNDQNNIKNNDIYKENFQIASTTTDIEIIRNFSKSKKKFNKENFNIDFEIENKFNRIVSYEAKSLWHAPNQYFGNNLFNSRLVLVFFFDLDYNNSII